MINSGNGRKIGLEKQIADKYISHPTYRDTNKTVKIRRTHDIGLIRLKRPFTRHRADKNSHFMINTICLPTKHYSNYSKEEATLFGFGKIGVLESSNSLQTADFVLPNPGKCEIDGICIPFTTWYEPRSCEVLYNSMITKL